MSPSQAPTDRPSLYIYTLVSQGGRLSHSIHRIIQHKNLTSSFLRSSHHLNILQCTYIHFIIRKQNNQLDILFNRFKTYYLGGKWGIWALLSKTALFKPHSCNCITFDKSFILFLSQGFIIYKGVVFQRFVLEIQGNNAYKVPSKVQSRHLSSAEYEFSPTVTAKLWHSLQSGL